MCGLHYTHYAFITYTILYGINSLRFRSRIFFFPFFFRVNSTCIHCVPLCSITELLFPLVPTAIRNVFLRRPLHFVLRSDPPLHVQPLLDASLSRACLFLTCLSHMPASACVFLTVVVRSTCQHVLYLFPHTQATLF